jgi:hypothetical protein
MVSILACSVFLFVHFSVPLDKLARASAGRALEGVGIGTMDLGLV